MTPEQAAHYKMLAEAHKDTPGDLAAAYREIGRLIEALEWISYLDSMSGANETQRGLIIEAAKRARHALGIES